MDAILCISRPGGLAQQSIKVSRQGCFRIEVISFGQNGTSEVLHVGQ